MDAKLEADAQAVGYAPWEAQLMDSGFALFDSSAFRASKWEPCQDHPCNPDKPCAGHIDVVFHRTKKAPDQDGARWRYCDVPHETFDAMGFATGEDSPGKFFAREIKGKKKAFKLEVKP